MSHVENILHMKNVGTNLFCHNSCCFFAKSLLLPFTLFCHEIFFVAIYVLLRTGKLKQKLWLWRKGQISGMPKWPLNFLFYAFCPGKRPNPDFSWSEPKPWQMGGGEEKIGSMHPGGEEGGDKKFIHIYFIYRIWYLLSIISLIIILSIICNSLFIIHYRLKGYSCGNSFVTLSEIPTLKDLPPPTLTIEEEERIKEDLFKKLDMQSFKEAGDLSMKVSWFSTSTLVMLHLSSPVRYPNWFNSMCEFR